MTLSVLTGREVLLSLYSSLSWEDLRDLGVQEGHCRSVASILSALPWLQPPW